MKVYVLVICKGKKVQYYVVAGNKMVNVLF